jgi:hypothetical protein
LQTVKRFSAAAEIDRLDPERDYSRIYALSQCYDFPFETLRSVEFGLFKAYCVPVLASLLVATRQIEQRPQSRYDNTVFSILGVVEYGIDSPQARAILRHLNRMHGYYDIAPKHFRYTVAASVMEPIYFNRRFGWRPFSEKETLGYFYFWRKAARLMNVEYFDSLADLERFYLDYEAAEFAYSPEGRFLGEENIKLFVSWYPRVLTPALRVFALTLLGPSARAACGLPTPSRAAQAAVHAAMRLRARALALRPAPTRPHLMAQAPHRTFPRGFDVERLRDVEVREAVGVKVGS